MRRVVPFLVLIGLWMSVTGDRCNPEQELGPLDPQDVRGGWSGEIAGLPMTLFLDGENPDSTLTEPDVFGTAVWRVNGSLERAAVTGASQRPPAGIMLFLDDGNAVLDGILGETAMDGTFDSNSGIALPASGTWHLDRCAAYPDTCPDP